MGQREEIDGMVVGAKLKIAIEYVIMSLILICKENKITIVCEKGKDGRINFDWDVKSVKNK